MDSADSEAITRRIWRKDRSSIRRSSSSNREPPGWKRTYAKKAQISKPGYFQCADGERERERARDIPSFKEPYVAPLRRCCILGRRHDRRPLVVPCKIEEHPRKRRTFFSLSISKTGEREGGRLTNGTNKLRAQEVDEDQTKHQSNALQIEEKIERERPWAGYG